MAEERLGIFTVPAVRGSKFVDVDCDAAGGSCSNCEVGAWFEGGRKVDGRGGEVRGFGV